MHEIPDKTITFVHPSPLARTRVGIQHSKKKNELSLSIYLERKYALPECQKC